MKAIGKIIHFDTYWETPRGKHAGTIIGYDMGHSKYQIEKHARDGKPMKDVIEWIFVRKQPTGKISPTFIQSNTYPI